MTYRAYDGSSRGWIDSGVKYADEFKSLGGDLEGMSSGASYGDGLYQVVTMNADQAGWGSAVPGGYEKVAYMDTNSGGDDTTPGKALLRKIGGQAKAPQSEPQKPYEPDQAKMAEAFTRAQLAKDQYAASIPTYDTGKDPYTAASQYGRQMQDSLLKYQDFADAKAGAQTTEISEAGKSALSRFGGKVADYQLPNWRDYLNA